METNSNMPKELIESLQMPNGLFEVRGPAGAGKTYQLIKSIDMLSSIYRRGFIISYSNTAVDELVERLGSNFNGKVMTSHVFSWMWIKRSYRYFLKDPAFKWTTGIEGLDFSTEHIRNIKYSLFGQLSYENTEKTLYLSHIQVLDLFSTMLNYSEKMQLEIKKVIDYIFVDEYQDTHKVFISAIINNLNDKILIGCFGDPMQNIYQNNEEPRVGDIQNISVNLSSSIELTTNFRSSKNLVSLFNLYRRDKIKQKSDSTSLGKFFLIASPKKLDIDLLNKIQTKIQLPKLHILALTHATRLQATLGNEFSILKKIKRAIDDSIPGNGYADWQQILDPDSDLNQKILLDFLLHLGSGNFTFKTIKQIKEHFELDPTQLFPFDMLKTIQKIIVSMKFLDLIDYGFNDYSEFLIKLEHELTGEDFDNLTNLYLKINELDSETIYSSKGKEYENVLLNIDSGGWWRMNWDHIKSQTELQNLFYVGITRARSNLIVYVNTSKDCGHSEFALTLEMKWNENNIIYQKISDL